MVNSLRERMTLVLILTVFYITPGYCTEKKDPITDEPLIRLGGQMSAVSITHPVSDFDPYQPLEPQTMTRGMGYQYPTVPLAGFTPYIAVSLSNKNADDEFDWEHKLENKYTGSPLKPGPTVPFVIGVLDSGAEVDLIAGSASSHLGITSQYLNGDTLPIGGVGSGSVLADITTPIGFYMAGLGDIDVNNQIDPNSYVGHSNNMMISAPGIICNNQEVVSALAGRALVGFYTTVIRNDQRKTVVINGSSYSGPDIQFLPAGSTAIPPYSHRISLDIGNGILPITTASYYYYEGFGTLNPTVLSSFAGSMSLGGSFTIEVDVTHNGRTKTYNFMFDTGAQSTIISTDVASSLGLPLNGDFHIDICGVSGLIEDVPGYYLDQVDIYGLGGPLNYSHVPVIVSDTASTYDGILGMNFFYDRNITFAPIINSSIATCSVYVSDPVEFADTDFNDDNKVNLQDFALFAKSWLANSEQPDYNMVYDLFLDELIDSTDLEILLQKWLD